MNKPQQITGLGLRGRIKVEVIDYAGRVVQSRPWQRNLWLDQGLNNLATMPLAQLFEWAAKGTDRETVTGTYSRATTTVTRVSGARNFSSADVGKYIHFITTGVASKIVTFTDTTHVVVADSGTVAAQNIFIYGNLAKDVVATANNYTLAGSVLTRGAGTAHPFTTADVGKLARRADTPFTECIITGIVDVDNANVRAVGQTSLANYTAKDIILFDVGRTALVAETTARTQTYSSVAGENATLDAAEVRTLTRTFIFAAEAEALEDIADSNTYSRATTTVTRAAGTRDFTAADVGKYLYFDTAGTLTKITAFTDATHVTVAGSGTITAQTAKLYGFFTYGEIGLSHSSTAAANLNVRVMLDDGSNNPDPVTVDGSNPETPGQQLKVTYEVEIAVGPATSTPGTAQISDAANAMSANKAGDYAIEHIALSGVDSDGATNLDFATLEPSIAGQVALSSSLAAIVALDGPDRSPGAEAVDLTNAAYVADSFTIVSEGVFGLNDANATNWRTMGLWDPESERFPFVFVFDANQLKDADHVITLRFRKTWNRDLA